MLLTKEEAQKLINNKKLYVEILDRCDISFSEIQVSPLSMIKVLSGNPIEDLMLPIEGTVEDSKTIYVEFVGKGNRFSTFEDLMEGIQETINSEFSSWGIEKESIYYIEDISYREGLCFVVHFRQEIEECVVKQNKSYNERLEYLYSKAEVLAETYRKLKKEINK